MSTIVTRAGKGSPLTNTELDSNFTNLNTDKAELSGATFTGNLSLGDGVSANFGASNDLTITHTGSSSILKENGTGTFYIQGTDIVFTNSAGSERYADFTDNGAVRLYHNNNEKLATTSTGIDVTGTATMDSLTTDDDVSGTNTLGRYSSGFAYSLIRPSSSALGIEIRTNAGNALAHFLNDGTTKLHHNGSSKLATTSTGIDVTGSVVADGLTVDTGSTFALSATLGHTGGSQLFFLNDDGGSRNQIDSQKNSASADLDLATGGVKRQKIASNGDISFYNSAGSSQNLFWDSSTSRLGLGTTVPASLLHISGANGSGRLELQNTWGTTVTNWRIAPVISGVSNNGFEIRDVTQGVSRFVINSSGNASFSGAVTSTGLTVSGNSTFQGSTTTIGNATSNVNVEFNLNGVASKAQRIQFQENGVNKWLLGQGAASETSAFELFNASGVIALSVNKTTNAATFASSVTSTGLTASTSGNQVLLLDSVSGATSIQMRNGSGSINTFIKSGIGGSSNLKFETGSADALTLDASQNVNIPNGSLMVGSTTAPSGLVHVASSKGSGGDLWTQVGAGNTSAIHIQNTANAANTNAVLYFRNSVGEKASVGARFVNQSTGETELRFSTTNSSGTSRERVTIGGDGRVGIGTSSPSAKLDVLNGGNTYTSGLLLRNGTSTSEASSFWHDNQNATTTWIENRYDNAGSAIKFRLRASNAAAGTAMTINGDGNVGIGESSPNRRVIVKSADGVTNSIQFQSPTTGNAAGDGVGVGMDSTRKAFLWNYEGNDVYLGGTGVGVAMTLTSGGDLLVGQTTNAETGTGIGLVPNGTSHMYSANTDALMLGRGGSDGEILSFNRSGTTVGSVGTNSGYMVIGSPVGTDAHLLIGNGLIHPATSTGSSKDNAIDLGGSSSRFKDLYLSGNATAQKLTLTKDPVGTYTIEVDGTNTGQPNLIVKQSTSERLRIDNQGRVGIGTSSPIRVLDIATTTGGTIIHLTDDATGHTATDGVDIQQEGTLFQILNREAGDIRFGTDNATRMTIDSVGSVGIGTAPSTWASTVYDALQIGGSIGVGSIAGRRDGVNQVNFGLNWHYASGATLSYVGSSFATNYAQEAGTHRWFHAASGTAGGALTFTESMRIDSSGRVGIGVNSMTQKLALGGDAHTRLHIDGSTSSGVYFTVGGANGGTIRSSTANQLEFYTTNEAMRIDSSGNLLVGTTGANTYSSTVNTGVQIAPDFIGVARNQNTVMHLNRQGNDGTIVDFRTFGFVRGSVSISGSTTSYNTSSDERLKDNIIDAPIASEDIDAIQVRSFDWKADGEHQKYGMVAQELLEVAPDAVTQGDTPDDMMGVDYSKLVPMLIKEIQSLRQRVAQLEE